MKEWTLESRWRDDKPFKIFFPENVEIANFYVYILFYEGKIRYVGATRNYKSRMRSHNSQRKFDCGIIIACDCVYDALFLERDMIVCLTPPTNFPSEVPNEEVLKKWRRKNQMRWDYFLSNKHKPSSESKMYFTKRSVIILNRELINELDIENYGKYKNSYEL